MTRTLKLAGLVALVVVLISGTTVYREAIAQSDQVTLEWLRDRWMLAEFQRDRLEMLVRQTAQVVQAHADSTRDSTLVAKLQRIGYTIWMPK